MPRNVLNRMRQNQVALAVLASLGACASYEPEPLELERFVAEWRADLGRDVLRAAASTAAGAWNRTQAEAALLAGSPALRTARAEVAVREAAAEHAGALPDPVLELDALRILSNVAEPWLGGAGIAWQWPFASVRDAAVDGAHAAVTAQRLAVAARELEELAEFGVLWATWSASQQRLAFDRSFAARLEELAAAVNRLAESGEATALEAGIVRVEAQRAAVHAARHAETVAIERRRLLAAMGLPGETPLEFDPGADAPSVRDVDGAASSHPRVRAAAAEYEVAEQALREQVANQFPGVGLGPRVEHEEGDTRVGLGVSIPLPLWNQNRGPIAVARAKRTVARRAAEAAVLDLIAERARWRAEWRQATAEVEALRDQVRPAVERHLDEARELIRLGEASTVLLLDVFEQARLTMIEQIDAEERLHAAAARLRALQVPPESLPPSVSTGGDAR